jgi:hypothetical protein
VTVGQRPRCALYPSSKVGAVDPPQTIGLYDESLIQPNNVVNLS